jgi:ATP-dependent DNA ligase
MGKISDALGVLLAGVFKHDDQPPVPQPVQMIEGGLNAPELCMLPRDLNPADFAARLAKGERWVAGLKGDGIRGLYTSGRLVTREGVPLDCALHCLPGVKRLEAAFGVPMYFDGEYIEEEGFDATVSAFRRGDGTGVFWIFDALPLLEWQRNDCGRSLEERLALLEELAPKAESPFVGMLKHWPVDSFEQFEGRVRELWAMRYEGVVAKRLCSLYRRRKDDDWLRWKETITIDCAVIDVLAKDGVLRGIMVRGPDGPMKVTAGFKREEIEHLAKGYGGVVEIAYNRKAGSAKARHARFIRLRPDKETTNGQ